MFAANDGSKSRDEAFSSESDPAPGIVSIRKQNKGSTSSGVECGEAEKRDTVEAASGGSEMFEDDSTEHGGDE